MSSKKIQLCPVCDSEISKDEVNISEGVALCSNCGSLSKLSELNYSGISIQNSITSSPKGVAITSNFSEINIKISLFSIPKFLGSLAFTLFWNGIVSIFLSLAAATIYYNLIGPVPSWFPTPGLKDGVPIMNDAPMGPGMTIFICLFLTPFVVIGTGMTINTLIRLFGKTNIKISQNESYVSTGISFLRFKSKFVAQDTKSVKEVVGKFSQENQTSYVIQISSSKTVKFGMLLSEDQREWVLSILHYILVHKKDPEGNQRLTWLN